MTEPCYTLGVQQEPEGSFQTWECLPPNDLNSYSALCSTANMCLALCVALTPEFALGTDITDVQGQAGWPGWELKASPCKEKGGPT